MAGRLESPICQLVDGCPAAVAGSTGDAHGGVVRPDRAVVVAQRVVRRHGRRQRAQTPAGPQVGVDHAVDVLTGFVVVGDAAPQGVNREMAGALDRFRHVLATHRGCGLGYTSLTATLGLPDRRALCAGLLPPKGAARRSAGGQLWCPARLPQERHPRLADTGDARQPDLAAGSLVAAARCELGVGVGLEMFFGTDEFLARPVTF